MFSVNSEGNDSDEGKFSDRRANATGHGVIKIYSFDGVVSLIFNIDSGVRLDEISFSDCGGGGASFVGFGDSGFGL